MDVYAVVFISTANGIGQKQRTCTDKTGDSDPTWNFPMKFIIDESAGLNNRLTLVVKLKAAGMFGGKNIGEVHVPVKELLEGLKDNRKAMLMKSVSYQVRRPSGKPKGVLSFSYEFGEKITGLPAEPVTAYPRGMVVGSSSGYPTSYAATGGYYPPQQPAGYAYPNQQPGYTYYPPPPPPPPVTVVQPSRSRMSSSGMGFGTGLLGGALGGMLLGDIMSGCRCSGGGGGGGGCDGGGGGCGGGCGGGGSCGGF